MDIQDTVAQAEDQLDQSLADKTAERVKKVIAETLGVKADGIRPEQSFSADLGADSLDGYDLLIDLEDEFGVEVADDDWEKVSTVAQAIALMHRYVVTASAPKRHGVQA